MRVSLVLAVAKAWYSGILCNSAVVSKLSNKKTVSVPSNLYHSIAPLAQSLPVLGIGTVWAVASMA